MKIDRISKFSDEKGETETFSVLYRYFPLALLTKLLSPHPPPPPPVDAQLSSMVQVPV